MDIAILIRTNTTMIMQNHANKVKFNRFKSHSKQTQVYQLKREKILKETIY